MPFVSRGGLKLEKALTLFKINLTGKIVLDIGSSTGGFSDCALQHGAQHIIAVDTGTNQMDSILRQDKRISLFEQTDFRTLAAKHLDKVQLATIDISFLSVTKILDKLITIPNLDEIICLIKPQFECGKEIANKYKGVIKNPTIHQTILKDVITAFEQHHFNIKNLTFSPITGVSGNIEYLGYFTKLPPVLVDINAIVHDAFNTL